MSHVRDSHLLDAIEAIEPTRYDGTVWRVVRESRDPLLASQSGGRWDDGTFDVLYTSLEKEGAIAETRFHLKRGQPVIPSKPRYELYELTLRLAKALQLLDLASLRYLGVNTEHYGAASYEERRNEYPRTQEIGEAAHFLGFDGLLVPNARYDCQNAVLFDDQCVADCKSIKKCHGIVEI